MKKDIYNLKEGDRIRILKRPSAWSSNGGGQYPLDLKFPIIVVVKKIQNRAMLCTKGFGWSLESISYIPWKLLSEDEEGEHFLGFI